MNENAGKKIEVDSATIGIDFANGNGNNYFTIHEESNLEELFDRTSKIHIDEGTVENHSDCRSVSIQFQGSVYERFGTDWTPAHKEYYWHITLDEQGRVLYEDKEYVIKGNVDWEGLYKLALSEYYGVNKELYQKWLGQ